LSDPEVSVDPANLNAWAEILTAAGGYVDHLYSLYDALISINVPGDKARAVVDAMERDMLDKLATKTDLQLLQARMETLIARQTAGIGSIAVVSIGILYTLIKLA
jgi:hypothetical protein